MQRANGNLMIIVYLDTQDFARLYKDNLSSELAEVKAKLLDFKRSGVVSFPLTFLTLFEFIQDYRTEFENDRQQRSNFMSQICGTDTLPYFADLMQTSSKVDTTSWIPASSIEEFSVSRMLSAIRHTIKEDESIPKQLKRELQNPNVLKNRLRDHIESQLSENYSPEAWKKETGSFSFEFFVDYLLGKTTEVEANEQFRQSVFEPGKFFALWYQRLSKKNMLTEHFQKEIDEFFAICCEFHAKLPKLYSEIQGAHTKIKRLKREIDKHNLKLKSIGLEELRIDQHIDLALPNLDEVFNSEKFRVRFGKFADPFNQVVKQYFIALARRQFTPKKSDVIDIFHALYINHVDLWRTDIAFSDFLLKLEIFDNSKIVPNLIELPNRIERLVR
jgi:hypothetical protein